MDGTLRTASQLTLAAVLLATVGGFGSLFSLLISPEIRAYNRICPFIEFFALLAIAFTNDRLCATPRRRLIAAGALLAVGLADQRSAAAGLNAEYAGVAAELPTLQTFVRAVEDRLPEHAMVLQLPFRTYMNDDGVARMKSYEHLKLYWVSHRVRWSYPALSNEQVRWQLALSRLDPLRLADQAAAEGFSAIAIDRYGYEDSGERITAAIAATLDTRDTIARTERYVAFDIRSLSGGNRSATRLSTAPATASQGLPACNGQPLMSVDRIGTHSAPFGPASLPVARDLELRVSGWAVDQAAQSVAAGVDLMVGERGFATL
jgi:phosphoglycerol transferase